MLNLLMLGINEPLMSETALLARELSMEVTAIGSNRTILAKELEKKGVRFESDSQLHKLLPAFDLVVIGATLQRGDTCVEQVLNKQIPFVSAPEFLYQYILKHRHVLAVCGATNDSILLSLLVWVLDFAKLSPGFLLHNAEVMQTNNVELGQHPYFIIRASAQETAFFDQRAQFLHYRPRTLIINDGCIQAQYPYLLRQIPAAGAVVYEKNNQAIEALLKQNCWFAVQTVGVDGIWQARAIKDDGSQFELWHRADKVAIVNWGLTGRVNLKEALIVMAAAHELGIAVPQVVKALEAYQSVLIEVEAKH